MRHFITALLAALTAVQFSMLDATIPWDVEIPEGAYAVWECPALGTATPIYKVEGTGQSVIDKENSAAIRAWGEGRLIGDHAGSVVDGGEWWVNEMVVGGHCYLVREDKPTKDYICTAIWLCDDTGYTYLYNGKSIRAAKDDIICACCASEKAHDKVYLAYYDYIGEMPEF